MKASSVKHFLSTFEDGEEVVFSAQLEGGGFSQIKVIGLGMATKPETPAKQREYVAQLVVEEV